MIPVQPRIFIITLEGNPYSERSANRCAFSGNKYHLYMEYFDAIHKDNAIETMEEEGLEWTWNTKDVIAGLKQFEYKTKDIRLKIACSMSHYLLWKRCVEIKKPIIILEHDAVFINPLPDLDQVKGICQLNDPTNCTPRGSWWAQQIKKKGIGVHDKTVVFNDGRPDGLAGNSAYYIKPSDARKVIAKTKEVGLWPNDAIICRQFFKLQEVYPFVTRVMQQQSTTV